MIVIYKHKNSSCNQLRLDSKYLVKSINDNDIILFGFIKKFDKQAFTNEDETEIIQDKYLSKLCLTKKNVHTGDNILCVENYGNDVLQIGSIYEVKELLFYGNKKTKVGLVGFGWNNSFDMNMFILYDSSTDRYQKYQKIFNEISLFRPQYEI